ncbi:MAG: lipase family protein [Gammaproteobacteria bacterium]
MAGDTLLNIFNKMLNPDKTLQRTAYFSRLFIFCLITAVPGFVHGEQQRFTEKDFSHWLDDAYIAQATYESSDELSKLLGKRGYTVTKSQQITGYEVSYTLATNDVAKKHILAVRGTANLKNVIVNSAFVLVPDKLSGIDIHQGFLLSARDIYQQVQPVIKPGYTIDTVGHSLGGAAALILAMMLDAQGYPVGEVVTFGQPKVTNITGSRKFKHLNIKRLVTDKDMVPLVPPVDLMDLMKLSIFWHQGTEIVLYEDNRYSVLTGMDSMRRAADFLSDMPSEQHLNNHFMTTYIQYLKAKLNSPEEVKYESDFSFSDWFGSSPKTKTR